MNDIPARYIGGHTVTLQAGIRKYCNIDGSPRDSLSLCYGDELLMPAREVLGQTYLFDPHGIKEPLDLGPGRVVLPEHKDLTDEELTQLGYEFHQGRPDMEPIVIETSPAAQMQEKAQTPFVDNVTHTEGEA